MFERISVDGKIHYKIVCESPLCNKSVIKKRKPSVGKFCSHACINKGKKHSKETKEKIANSVCGDKNGFYGKKHTEDTLNSLREKCGLSLEEKYGEKKAKDMRRQQSILMSGENNHFYGKKHSKESKEKMSKTKSKMIAEGIWHPKDNRGYKGYYLSKKTENKEFYDSLYELIRMKILDMDENVIYWTKKHGIRLGYTWQNKNRMYIPDFLIETKEGFILEEIKGYEKKEKIEAKNSVAKKYCDTNGYIFSFVERCDINKMCIENLDKSYRLFVKEYKNE